MTWIGLLYQEMLPEDDMYVWNMDRLDVVEDSDHLRRALVDPGKYGGNSRRVCQAGRHAVAGQKQHMSIKCGFKNIGRLKIC